MPLFSSFREERIMLGECPMALSADQVLQHLDHPWQTDLLLWLQMTILVGGMLWCLALTLTLGFGGWYAVTHPETGRDHTILLVAHVLYLLTFGLTEYPPPTAEGTKLRGNVSMDKQEAERLVRAIERMHVAWLQVDQIVFDETRNAYELKCSYRGPAGFLGARAVWRTRWISSPREWIDLLITQRDTL
jgi:hypothetical protein